MNLYRVLYFFLFRRMAEATEAMEQGDFSAARAILIAAQREAEERFLSAEENAPD
ncbi:MAG: hypothetical protein RR035_07600 [Oscillibacter sp.]